MEAFFLHLYCCPQKQHLDSNRFKRNKCHVSSDLRVVMFLLLFQRKYSNLEWHDCSIQKIVVNRMSQYCIYFLSKRHLSFGYSDTFATTLIHPIMLIYFIIYKQKFLRKCKYDMIVDYSELRIFLFHQCQSSIPFTNCHPVFTITKVIHS